MKPDLCCSQRLVKFISTSYTSLNNLIMHTKQNVLSQCLVKKYWRYWSKYFGTFCTLGAIVGPQNTWETKPFTTCFRNKRTLPCAEASCLHNEPPPPGCRCRSLQSSCAGRRLCLRPDGGWRWICRGTADDWTWCRLSSSAGARQWARPSDTQSTGPERVSDKILSFYVTLYVTVLLSHQCWCVCTYHSASVKKWHFSLHLLLFYQQIIVTLHFLPSFPSFFPPALTLWVIFN